MHQELMSLKVGSIICRVLLIMGDSNLLLSSATFVYP